MRPDETVAGRFVATAARFGDRAFLRVLPETAEIYGLVAGDLTYGAVAEQVAAMAQAYRAAGYGPGVRVGVLLLNRPDFVLHVLALNAVGASIVPINPDLRAAELEYMIGHSEMAAAVAVPERTADLEAAAMAIGRKLDVVAPDAAPPGVTDRALAEAHNGGNAGDTDSDRLGADTEAAILYTSGTTGRPKGCVLTNTYFLHCGDWYANLGGHCALRGGEEVMITPLPLFHMNALACSLTAILTIGGTLVLVDRFHPRSWWDCVRSSGATCLHYLGIMPTLLMKAPPAPADRDHTIRFGFGAGVDRTLHAAFEERFGFPLIEAWAMTETGVGACVIANREPRKIGTNCFGRPAPEVEVDIVGDDGRPAAADEPGELLVRRAGSDPRFGFFREYLKDPEATAAAWDGGWFHTGDVVRADADGDLHFVDRKKNVIRRSGENIAAVEVEEVLKQHADVANAAVAAVADPVRGDEVFACIILAETAREGHERLAARVQAWCLERLAYYKAPGYVAFVDTLPLTATNKVQRGDLRALAVRLHGTGACIDLRHLKKRTA